MQDLEISEFEKNASEIPTCQTVATIDTVDDKIAKIADLISKQSEMNHEYAAKLARLAVEAAQDNFYNNFNIVYHTKLNVLQRFIWRVSGLSKLTREDK